MREIKIEYILQDKETKKIDKIRVSLEQIETNTFKILDCLNNEYIEVIAKRQYTEAEDKNDKEIYDGDILYCEEEDYKGIVEFKNGGFMTNARGFGDEYLESDEFEIIGNIYENPGLLEIGA